MMVTNSVLAAATASMLLLTSPFVAVHAQDPQGTCEQDSDQCGEYSVARAIQNGNTALGGYCSVGGGADNSAGKMETQLRDYVVPTAPGQFLVQAKEYKFQVTNDPGPNDENVLFLDAKNIQRLQDAIDSLPTRRRELSPEMTDKRVLRREAKERRQRKLQLAREKYGLS